MEHNVYFDGKVQGLGFRSDRGEATVRFKFAGHDWRDVRAGDKVVIPAGAEVTWEIDPGADACYFCLFR
jgi:uncharacterized protein YaiE (UPF0345 family)